MSEATITEIRALICSAMSDIGGSCERLRELEDGDLRAAVVTDSREEIATWLSQACDRLGEAALLAESGE
ncbi:MAG: hypothetical protein ACOYNN_04085 [Terrimicrobiaceae bacterium]